MNKIILIALSYIFLSQFLLAYISTDWNGTEAGNLIIAEDSGEAFTESNRVNVPAGSVLKTANAFVYHDFSDGTDELVISTKGQEFVMLNGGSTSFANRQIYGPCEVFLRISDFQNKVRFLPYWIESISTSSGSTLVIPASQSVAGSDLIIQASSDMIEWSNVNYGSIVQSNYPKYFRLVINNPAEGILSTNRNFGFGDSQPMSTSILSKIIPKDPENNSHPPKTLLSLSEGEIFRPLNDITFQGVRYFFTNDLITLPRQFMETDGGDHNNHSSVGQIYIVGPAVIYYYIDDSNQISDSLVYYSIITQLEDYALSGGSITIPSGTGSYDLKIQYSEDLTSDWIDLQQGVGFPSVSTMRFYRLIATPNE